MIYVHKEGKVAEYTPSEDGYFDLTKRPDGQVWFDNKIYLLSGTPDGWYESKEKAYGAAVDYHETEGCNAYLELYPAPEKKYGCSWIAQDTNGHWYGYWQKPKAGNVCWDSQIKSKFICESPPNPFWRKTLR